MPHPDYLHDSLTSEQFSEIDAFYQANPMGNLYWDIAQARICSLLYNANRGKNAPAKEIEDFLFAKLPSGTGDQTPDEMLAVIKGLEKRWRQSQR